MSKSDLVDISVEVRVETKKAWLLYDGAREAWVPKSQAELHIEPGKGTTLTCPEWLARDKGFI